MEFMRRRYWIEHPEKKNIVTSGFVHQSISHPIFISGVTALQPEIVAYLKSVMKLSVD
jgi:hypothetical protein